jgi:hypothetical protein
MNPFSESNRERRNLSNNLRRIINFDERDTIIACLYVNSEENVNRLAKLFNLETEKIINILKKEQLYDYKICTGCFKLKSNDDF